MAQWARDASGGVFGVPRFDPRAYTFFKAGDNLRRDTGVDVLTVGFVVHGISSLINFFRRKPRRSGRRSAARSSQGRSVSGVHGTPLTASTDGVNAGFQRRG